MSLREVVSCDLCREDHEGYYGVSGKMYGLQGPTVSDDCKFHLNEKTTEDDNFHLCHSCLKRIQIMFVAYDQYDRNQLHIKNDF